MTNQLDIAETRRQSNYSSRQKLQRILWMLCAPLFRYSPRVCHRWRANLLRLFGAKIGKNVHIYNSACVYFPWLVEIGDDSAVGEHALLYNLGPIRIGERATISQRAHLCAGTHDFRDPTMPLLKLPITIGDDAWVCADAFIGPDVTVGDGAVVGARAVAVKDVEAWTVVAGNPARFIKPRTIEN